MLQAPVKNDLFEYESDVAALFSAPISVVVLDPTSPRSAAYPEEAAALPPMRALRRREFLAGREALRQAIVGLGERPCAIPMKDDRSPDLPEHVRASLSHTEEICVAVADLASRSEGVGIDIEPAESLDPALWTTVCTRAERKWLSEQDAAKRGILAKQIFCAKEAAYKCQFALSGQLIDFDAFEITLHPKHQVTATFRKDVAPFSTNDQIRGKLGKLADHIVAAFRIPA